MGETKPAISVDHPVALSDQALKIALSGFPPDAIVEIETRRRDLQHRPWRAWARFRTDGAGTLDLTAEAPLEGSYEGVSAMGLFWSAVLEEAAPSDAPAQDITAGITVRLTARALEGDAAATTEVRRLFTGPGVTSRELRERGLVGRLFLPAGLGPHPTMIVLAGSSGGLNLPVSALLASHGYAALALGTFNMPGLPSSLVEIPLEYFERAIDWLAGQAAVDQRFIGVTGVSRGGELALLLGATFPSLRAVVAIVPSGVVHAGIGRSASGGDVAAWTHRGEPLPYLQENNRCTDNAIVDWALAPVATTPIFESSLRDEEAVERAMIPVERIKGPVLMISGGDDLMWPSAALSNLVLRRLEAHSHPYPYAHLSYPGAGHMIFPPYAPTTQRHAAHRVIGTDFAFGGSAAADAEAGEDSWRRVLSFLEAAVESAKAAA